MDTKQPRTTPSAAADPRTTTRTAMSTGTIVTLGMSLLALIGVATVFGRTLAAAIAPPTASHDEGDPR